VAQRTSLLLIVLATLTAPAQADTPTAASVTPPAAARPQGAEAALARRIISAGPVEIESDAAMRAFVKSRAERAIATHCASCHGRDLKGARPGVPDLTDYDLLWNTGAMEEIDATQVMSLQQSILWGIRNQDCPDSERKQQYGACPDTRYSHMPAYAKDGVYTREQIADLAEYVLALSKQQADATAAERGKKLYAEGCGECHAADGFGYGPYGGPNLTDDVWLFGGTRAAIIHTLANGPGPEGNGGSCPAWGRKLDPVTIKALAIYIHGKPNEVF
jgi:cytochrome c oxidase cbb3-type subunit III